MKWLKFLKAAKKRTLDSGAEAPGVAEDVSGSGTPHHTAASKSHCKRRSMQHDRKERTSIEQWHEARKSRTSIDVCSSLNITTTERLSVCKAGMTILINRTYIVIKHLGSGTSGQVKLAFNLRSKKLVAIKAVRKSHCGAGGHPLSHANRDGARSYDGRLGSSSLGLPGTAAGGAGAAGGGGGAGAGALSSCGSVNTAMSGSVHSGGGGGGARGWRAMTPSAFLRRASSSNHAWGSNRASMSNSANGGAAPGGAASGAAAAGGGGGAAGAPGGPSQSAEDFVREIAILKRLSHPNVVQLLEVIDDPASDCLLLVMGYVEGATLQPPQLAPGRWKPVPEQVVWRHARDVLCGLEYLHCHSVVHGDLKPANFIQDSLTGVVRILDFGSAVFHGRVMGEEGRGAHHVPMSCTPGFRSPESLAAGYRSSFELDMWALGVCLYMWVFGELPFKGSAPFVVYENIRSAALAMPSQPRISAQLTDLISRLLDKDPRTRMTVHQAVNHTWTTAQGLAPLRTTSPLVMAARMQLDAAAAVNAQQHGMGIGHGLGGAHHHNHHAPNSLHLHQHSSSMPQLALAEQLAAQAQAQQPQQAHTQTLQGSMPPPPPRPEWISSSRKTGAHNHYRLDGGAGAGQLRQWGGLAASSSKSASSAHLSALGDAAAAPAGGAAAAAAAAVLSSTAAAMQMEFPELVSAVRQGDGASVGSKRGAPRHSSSGNCSPMLADIPGGEPWLAAAAGILQSSMLMSTQESATAVPPAPETTAAALAALVGAPSPTAPPRVPAGDGAWRMHSGAAPPPVPPRTSDGNMSFGTPSTNGLMSGRQTMSGTGMYNYQTLYGLWGIAEGSGGSAGSLGAGHSAAAAAAAAIAAAAMVGVAGPGAAGGAGAGGGGGAAGAAAAGAPGYSRRSSCEAWELRRSVTDEELSAAISKTCDPTGSAAVLMESIFSEVTFPAKTQIIRAGDPLDRIYLITAGEVEIYHDLQQDGPDAPCPHKPIIEGLSDPESDLDDPGNFLNIRLPGTTGAMPQLERLSTGLLNFTGGGGGGAGGGGDRSTHGGNAASHAIGAAAAAMAAAAAAGGGGGSPSLLPPGPNSGHLGNGGGGGGGGASPSVYGYTAAPRTTGHGISGVLGSTSAAAGRMHREPSSSSLSMMSRGATQAGHLIVAVKGPGDSLGFAGMVPGADGSGGSGGGSIGRLSQPAWSVNVRARTQVTAFAAGIESLHKLAKANPQVEPLLQQMAVQQETDLAVAEAMRSLRLVGSSRPSANQLNVKTTPGSATAAAPAATATAGAGEAAGVPISAAATMAAAAAKAAGGLDSSCGRGFGSVIVSAVDIVLPELGSMPADPDSASQQTADAAAKVQCRLSGSGLGSMGGGGGGGSLCGGRGLHAGGLISSEAESESCGTAGTTATGLTALTAASSPGASLPQRLAVFATSSSGACGNVGMGGGSSYGALGGGGGGGGGVMGHNTSSGVFGGPGGGVGGAGMGGAGPGRMHGSSAQPMCGGMMGEAGDETAAMDMMVG